jgi:hypothetical protein
MKRYLLIKYWKYDPEPIVQIDKLEKEHLLDLKQGMCKAIIDTENQTYFDEEKNEWVKIAPK